MTPAQELMFGFFLLFLGLLLEWLIDEWRQNRRRGRDTDAN